MSSLRRRELVAAGSSSRAAAAPTTAQSLGVGLPAGVNRNSADDLAVPRGSRKPVRKGGQIVVGSFNFGLLQSMITGGGKDKYCAEFARVCAKIVEEGNCDLLFACEVGGFRQGFLKANIDVKGGGASQPAMMG